MVKASSCKYDKYVWTYEMKMRQRSQVKRLWSTLYADQKWKRKVKQNDQVLLNLDRPQPPCGFVPAVQDHAAGLVSEAGLALASAKESKFKASVAASFTFPLPCFAMGVSTAMPSAFRILSLASAWLAKFRRALAACHLASSLPLTTKATSPSHPPASRIAARFSSDVAAQFPSCSAALHCSSLVPSKAFTSTWTGFRRFGRSLRASGSSFRTSSAVSLPIFDNSSSLGSLAKASRGSRAPQSTMARATWTLSSAKVRKVKVASRFVRSLPSRSRATSSGKAPSSSMVDWIFSSSYAKNPKPSAAFRFWSSSAFGSFRTWTCSRDLHKFLDPCVLSVSVLGVNVLGNYHSFGSLRHIRRMAE